jgi:zinc protease
VDETRSRIRYGTALGWQSAGSIAGFLAPYIALTGSPNTVNKVFSLYNQITPRDIQENAKKYFTAENRTVVTLATKKEERK